MTQTLSHTEERRLLGAIKEAVELVEQCGLSPNDALYKIATQEEWTPGWIRLAAVAYNTGQQNAQRETSAGILDKLASFPLADADAVIRRIYPSNSPSLLEEKLASVSDEYDQPPPWLEQRRQERFDAAMPEVKQAATAEKRERDVFYRLQRYKQAAANLEASVRQADERFRESLDAFQAYFQKTGWDRMPFATVESAAKTWFPPAVQKLLDFTYQAMNLKEARARSACEGLSGMSRDDQPFCHLDRALAWSFARAKAKTALDHLQSRPAPTAAGLIRPFVSRPGKPATTKAGFEMGDISGVGKAKDLIQGTMGKLQDIQDEELNDDYLSLTDPQHEADLRRIRAQSMLSELMATDPVIKGYQPEHVMKNFNEVAEIAPRAATSIALMRPELRRRLSTNPQPFEARELADLEKSLTETHAARKGPSVPHGL